MRTFRALAVSGIVAAALTITNSAYAHGGHKGHGGGGHHHGDRWGGGGYYGRHHGDWGRHHGGRYRYYGGGYDDGPYYAPYDDGPYYSDPIYGFMPPIGLTFGFGGHFYRGHHHHWR